MNALGNAPKCTEELPLHPWNKSRLGKTPIGGLSKMLQPRLSVNAKRGCLLPKVKTWSSVVAEAEVAAAVVPAPAQAPVAQAQAVQDQAPVVQAPV